MTNYPKLSYISSITNGINPTVTFTEDHDFSIGEIVSFRVGRQFGMYQINNRRVKVLSVPTTDSVTIELDTSTWSVFSLDNLDEPGTSPPCCVPSSSGVVPNDLIPKTNIADAFDNRP